MMPPPFPSDVSISFITPNAGGKNIKLETETHYVLDEKILSEYKIMV